jgi:hypothetical protein
MLMNGTSDTVSTWAQAGIGLRVMQNVGAHRKKVYGLTPSVTDELWRRAFW